MMDATPLVSVTPELVVQNLIPAASWLSKATPFISALVGATVGGATGYLLQRNQFRNQQRQLADDRADAEEVAALGILVKINRVLTNIVRVRDHIDEGIAASASDPLRLWAKTMAFSSDLPTVEVSTLEAVFVKRLGDTEALNAVLDLPHVNATYVDNMGVYRQMRADLSERMLTLAVPDKVDGTMASAGFTDEQMMRLAPGMAALNDLLLAMRAMCDEHEREVLHAFREVQARAQNRLGERSPNFSIPEAPPVGV